MVRRIISGGQTGADRAALDVAIKLDMPHGGWIPKGRKTEAGILPRKYHMQEMPTASYPKRTEKNILDSDGTLILSRGKLTGGSALTRRLAKKHCRPWLHVDLDKFTLPDAVRIIETWINRHGIETLNVAGPMASKSPEIYGETVQVLTEVLGNRPGYSFQQDSRSTTAEPQGIFFFPVNKGLRTSFFDPAVCCLA